jgi:hypothetical protein
MSDHNSEILEPLPSGPPANEGTNFLTPLETAVHSASGDVKARILKSLIEDSGDPAPKSGAAGTKTAPEKPATSEDKAGRSSNFKNLIIPTIVGGLLVGLMIAYLTAIKDSITEGNQNLSARITEGNQNLAAMITEGDKNLLDRINGLDTRMTRLDEKMNVLSEAMVKQETRQTNLESTVTDLRTDLKTLTGNFETWRLATARFLPAPGTQSESAVNGERPEPSDITAGGRIPGQGPPASPGEPAPPAG